VFHVVFLDPIDDAYVATEDEAIQLIQERFPEAVLTSWTGQSMRAYPGEATRHCSVGSTRAPTERCSAFVIKLSQ
jgi:hypothetical protein